MKKLSNVFASFRFRKRVLALVDACLLVISGLMSGYLLPLFGFYQMDYQDMLISFVVGVFCNFSCLLFFGAYNKLWRYFNFRDYMACVNGVVMGMIVTWGMVFLIRGYVPYKYAAIHCVIAVCAICVFRYVFKGTFISLMSSGRAEASRKRTMIIGAGRACRMLLDEVFNSFNEQKTGVYSPAASIFPVCIIDDDRTKVGMIIHGVEVAGTTADIVKLCALKNIEEILFAIPSCPAADRQSILAVCAQTNLPVRVIPFFGKILQDDTQLNLVSQIRDIKVEDLLGRAPITFGKKNIADFIEGKTCMVTGGGGSIGSELVRQIAKYNPRQIIIVDIYENNAYDIQQELTMEYGSSLNLVTLIASVRDYCRMNQIFKTYQPDVVFHAAAHKHVPLMEHSPMEAIKNNVIGTFNMGTLAMLHNVKKFVMISTDKAVNPTNVMGASKRCCEMIIQYLSQQRGNQTEFVTTRFGNVLGSNGSVIPLFKRQIEQGKPVTVTHPDIIRYFMTIPEAVSLVMEAASIAKGGEIFVLDMGQPVKIVTLAENLIRMYGKVPYKDVKIKFTGLRPGEKIKEELLMNEEGLTKTENELIFIGRQLEINTEEFINQLWKLKSAAAENEDEVAIEALHAIVPTFTTPEEFNKKVLS